MFALRIMAVIIIIILQQSFSSAFLHGVLKNKSN
jgi:hypothetical protein